MPDIVLVNPRFQISYWGLEHALPLLHKRANLPTACLPLLAALTPKEHSITLVDENVEAIDFDRLQRADIVGLTGPTARAAIAVALGGPSVTSATTTESTQTTSGLVITPSPGDSMAEYFEITGIIGGMLYQTDGVTPIAGGSLITLAQGVAGLKFTPTTGSLTPGSFSIQESTSGTVSGLSGPVATATINVTPAGS